MKRMGKSTARLSAWIVLLCFCGCQAQTEAGEGEALPQLKIGIDGNYEPYSYIDESGDFAGLDIELAREACSRMNYEPVFYAMKWDYKDTYLADGSVDCIWSCFSMNGREGSYRWVGPYMCSRQVVVVDNDSEIQHISDLNGSTVAVMSSTKPESIFLQSDDSDDIPTVRALYSMEDMRLVLSALQQGYVDAAAAHETMIQQYMESYEGEFRLLDEELLSVDVGVAFSKDNQSAVPTVLARALADMEDDGTLAEILATYGVSGVTENGGESP